MKKILILTALLGLLSTGLLADEQVVRGACKADKEKFCKDVQQGDGRIMQCLSENKAQLSADCQKKIGNFDGSFQKACGGDLEKLCGGVEKGKGRRLKCLNEKSAQLTPACKTKMDELKASHQAKMEEHKQFREACKEDTKKLCKGVPHGQGRMLQCLREKQASASPACQAELAKIPAPQM